MSPMPGDSHAGKLLVATPVVRDPNFERTVVLLLEHGAEGAFGLVLNRPTELDLLDPLPQWYSHAATPCVVFVGGPVDQERAIALARAERGRDVSGWQSVLGPVGTLDLNRRPDEVGPGLGEIRVFAGYAGWGGDQLEGEIESGAWFICDARPEDVLCQNPSLLWSEVLKRQSGAMALFALYPTDPALN
jgi:putative transcriptional regulator